MRDQGEVFTQEREVRAMLGLVKNETERIESRFLEPACGNGNFLAPILEHKLELVRKRFKRSQLEYERNAIVAVGSLYGVEYLKDNVEECRVRLFNIFKKEYEEIYKKKVKDAICESVKAILNRNILWGDALSLKTPDEKAEHLIFSEWSRPFNDSRIKRHDYYFHELSPAEKHSIFTQKKDIISDEGVDGFIPEPQKSFPLTHITKLGEL